MGYVVAKPQRGCAGNLPLERGSLAMVWSHGIVDPEVNRLRSQGNAYGARRPAAGSVGTRRQRVRLRTQPPRLSG